MQNIIKDIGQIEHRLFDHTSAMQGEVKHFVTEFEPKISTEFDLLLQTSHALNESNDVDPVEKFNKAGGLDKINTKLDAVAAMLDKLVARGKSSSPGNKYESYKTRISDQQSKDLGKFIDEINEKRRQIDVDFEQKIVDLKNQYENLQHEN